MGAFIFTISLLSLIVMALDFILPFLFAIPYKNYRHTKMALSVIGCRKSPLGRIYSLWTIISGIVFILLAIVIFFIFRDISIGLSLTVMLLLIVYGLGCEVISGLFPVGETRDEVSLSSKIHAVGSVIGFLTLVFVPLILGILQFKTNSVAQGITSIIFFCLCIISTIIFVMGDKPKFKNTIIGLEGLWQRISLYISYIPIFIFCVYTLLSLSL